MRIRKRRPTAEVLEVAAVRFLGEADFGVEWDGTQGDSVGLTATLESARLLAGKLVMKELLEPAAAEVRKWFYRGFGLGVACAVAVLLVRADENAALGAQGIDSDIAGTLGVGLILVVALTRRLNRYLFPMSSGACCSPGGPWTPRPRFWEA